MSNTLSVYRPEGLKRDEFVEVKLVRGRGLTRYLLRALRGTGGVIAGGYARWAASTAALPAEAGDVDVFCRDLAAYERVRAVLQSRGHSFVRETRISCVFAGKRRFLRQTCPPINVVKPVNDGAIVTCGDLHEILHNFDLTVSKCGIVDDSTGLAHYAFADDERVGRMRFTRIHTPLTGIMRALKYSAKGYRISLREIMQLFRRWDEDKQGYRTLVKDVLHAPQGSVYVALSDATETWDPPLPIGTVTEAEAEPKDLELPKLLETVVVDIDEPVDMNEAYCYLVTGSRRWARRRRGKKQ